MHSLCLFTLFTNANIQLHVISFLYDFDYDQGMSGLRAIDKRRLTMYIPLLFILILFNNPAECTLDNTILLSLELLKMVMRMRSDKFSKTDIRRMTQGFKR